MPQHNLYLVVIAGGSGTRFWPKSTSKRPKQLLRFGDQPHTLLEQTLERFDDIVSPAHRLIVTTVALKDAIAQLDTQSVVLAEPQGRNTAPAIYWAARHIAEQDPNAVMLVMPSDHIIVDLSAFRDVVKKAAQWASSHDDLVTLGIKATRPETGYGYLKVSNCQEVPSRVEAFVEKPSFEKAKEFLASGDYLWNGGMFVWRNDVLLAAFDKHMPELRLAFENAHGNVVDAYPHMTATSIDYGIMERARNVVTFELDCGWDDVGSWASLESVAHYLNAQRGPNVVAGGEIFALESSGNIIDAPGKFVAALGVNDIILVESGDTIMIAKKDRAQDIKKLVDALKAHRSDVV